MFLFLFTLCSNFFSVTPVIFQMSSSPSSSWLPNCEDHLCIPVPSSSVHFLRTPDQFYNTLLQRIASAKRRVVLSALYLGTDVLEQRLVHRLTAAATSATDDGRPPLSIGILLDYFRATRGAATNGKSSTTMLAPLTANPNVQVRLFHTPKMRGVLKSALSERTNEIFGLQHMKFFVFDDTVLITGANLSDQYFVNRQDRYLLIENCPLLADFFVNLFHLVGDHSFRLLPDGSVEFPGGIQSPLHPETGSIPFIQRQVGDAVGQLFAKFKAQVTAEAKSAATRNASASSFDGTGKGGGDDGTTTFLVPFLQMGLFNVNQEVELLSKLFNNTSSNQNDEVKLEFTLITAYFNLFDTYADLILHKCRSPFKIVFASPQANGFLGAHGLSGHIPAMYEYCALEFVRRTVQANQAERVAFAEWTRPGWTFHAKGIWLQEQRQRKSRQQNCAASDAVADAGGGGTDWHPTGRVATVVGSSNFGFRSAHRDLEAQLLLVTDNDALRERIVEEKNSLFAHSELLDPSVFLRRDCLIPAWLKYAARLFRNFF